MDSTRDISSCLVGGEVIKTDYGIIVVNGFAPELNGYGAEF